MKNDIVNYKTVIVLLLVLFLANSIFAMDENTVDSILEKHMKDSDITGMGVGIIKNSELVYNKAKGVDGHGERLTGTSPMFIGSVSKSMTAIAVMQLVEKDLISLNSPVKNYIPYFKVANPNLSRKITVRDLLIQQSGLAKGTSIPSTDYNATIEQRVKDLSVLKEIADAGEEFHYFNDNYNILGLLIEEVTGKSYADYMKKNVFIPIGMFYTTADKKEIEEKDVYGHTSFLGFSKSIRQRVPLHDIPCGYILSNLEDMIKYLFFLIEPDDNILSKDGMEKMRMISENSDYAMGWEITEHEGFKLVQHDGAVESFSSNVVLIPETKSGFVYVGNKNHLFYMFAEGYGNLKNNLIQLIIGGNDFDYFPSILIIRILSWVILLLVLRDFWMTKKFINSELTKKKFIKEGVGSLLWILFYSIGLPLILTVLFSRRIDFNMMLGYAPDLFMLLLVAIFIQIVRLFVSLFKLKKGYFTVG